MATKKDPPVDGYPVGNVDPKKRGRGGDEPMGQDVPDSVRRKGGYPPKGK